MSICTIAWSNRGQTAQCGMLARLAFRRTEILVNKGTVHGIQLNSTSTETMQSSALLYETKQPKNRYR